MIVFDSNRDGTYQDIFVMDTLGSGITRLTRGESNFFAGPLSPDGTKILFTGYGLTRSYVGLMNADGSNPVDLSQQPNSDEGFATWSPDGQQIAFTSRRDGNNEIYIMAVDGSGAKRITSDPRTILHLPGHRTASKLPSYPTAAIPPVTTMCTS